MVHNQTIPVTNGTNGIPTIYINCIPFILRHVNDFPWYTGIPVCFCLYIGILVRSCRYNGILDFFFKGSGILKPKGILSSTHIL